MVIRIQQNPREAIREEDTNRILEPYEYRPGLTLEDIRRIFAEGHLPRGFGGARWAEITRTVIELRQLIDTKAWDRAPSLIDRAKKLRHNNGLLVDKFSELERLDA